MTVGWRTLAFKSGSQGRPYFAKCSTIRWNTPVERICPLRKARGRGLTVSFASLRRTGLLVRSVFLGGSAQMSALVMRPHEVSLSKVSCRPKGLRHYREALRFVFIPHPRRFAGESGPLRFVGSLSARSGHQPSRVVCQTELPS